jgi:hypothetical protein
MCLDQPGGVEKQVIWINPGASYPEMSSVLNAPIIEDQSEQFKSTVTVSRENIPMPIEYRSRVFKIPDKSGVP